MAPAGHCIAAKPDGRSRKRDEGERRKITSLEVVFWGNGAGRRLPSLSAPKAHSIRPTPVLDGPLKRGRRAMSAIVSFALRTIHPNPGPFGRDEEAKVSLGGRRKG